jgi:hypothetical protein
LEFDPYGKGHPPDTVQVAVAYAKPHVEVTLEEANSKVRLFGDH